MLSNRVYVGEFKCNSKEMDNKDEIEETFHIVVPQIISHSLFNRVHKKIKKNIKNYGNNLRKHDNLLGDLLVCSCGQNITGRTKKQNKEEFSFEGVWLSFKGCIFSRERSQTM